MPVVAPSTVHHTTQKETRKRRLASGNTNTSDTDSVSRRRTVPSALRKRTGHSCDLCKTRRVKCIRPTSAEGTEDLLGPCENCTKSHVLCRSELPRKTRIYGSVESLGTRYILLDALVKRLFPDRNTEDNEELMKITREFGISVPDLDPAEVTSSLIRKPEPAAGLPRQQLAFLPPQAPAVGLLPSLDDTEAGNNASPTADDAIVHQFSSYHSPGAPLFGDEAIDVEGLSQGSVHKKSSPDECLFPNTRGVMSYLGPSSSFRFMVSLRKLLAENGSGSNREHVATRHESLAIQEEGIEEAEADGENQAGMGTSAMHHDRQQASHLDFLNHQIDGEAVASPGSGIDRIRSHSPPSAQDRDKNFVQSIRDTLPPREAADVLVEAFFDKVHVNYVIFHRGLFQMQYESLFASQDEFAGEVDPFSSSNGVINAGWVCSIYMVFVFGHRALSDSHPDSHPNQVPALRHNYVNLVQKLLYRVISSTSLSNVQALLLIQLYQHNSGERNTAWMLLGCASRMAISMGMHRDGARGGFSPIIRELRRRVWWTMYTFERQLSLTLGRPPSIPEEDAEIDVGLPNEGMMDGKTYMPPGLLGNMLSLVKILVNIRRSFLNTGGTVPATSVSANQDSHCRVPGPNDNDTRFIIGQLDEWFRQLPSNHSLYWNAKGSNHYRAAHLLHMMYYHASQVITRSYLLQSLYDVLLGRDERQPGYTPQSIPLECPAEHYEYRNQCLSAALSGLQVFESLWNSEQVDGVAWLDIYWAYHSGIMLLVNLLRERHQSNESRSRIPPDQQAKDSYFVSESKPLVKRLAKIMQEVKLCKTMSSFANTIFKLTQVVGVDAENAEQAVDDFGAVSASAYGLVVTELAATDAGLNMPTVRSNETLGYADGWLSGWTDADFLFPLRTDGAVLQTV